MFNMKNIDKFIENCRNNNYEHLLGMINTHNSNKHLNTTIKPITSVDGLKYLVLCEDSVNSIRLLIENQWKISRNAIMRAIIHNKSEYLQIFLDYRKNNNIHFRIDKTALIIAFNNGNHETINVVLDIIESQNNENLYNLYNDIAIHFIKNNNKNALELLLNNQPRTKINMNFCKNWIVNNPSFIDYLYYFD